jgi:hypothetical protein
MNGNIFRLISSLLWVLAAIFSASLFAIRYFNHDIINVPVAVLETVVIFLLSPELLLTFAMKLELQNKWGDFTQV